MGAGTIPMVTSALLAGAEEALPSVLPFVGACGSSIFAITG